MAIGTTAALIGGSVLSAGVGALSAGKAAKAQERAANKAADAQLQAARESNELLRETYYHNVGLSEPWRQAGQNALAQMSALMGLPGFDAEAAAAATGGAANTNAPWGSDTPTIVANTTAAPRGSTNQMEDNRGFGRFLGNGQAGAGTTTYSVGDASFDTQDAAQAYIDSFSAPPQPTYTASTQAPMTQQQAFDAFRATPGYQFQLDEGNKAIERGAAARGLRLSGGTLKGLQQYGQGLADTTYGDYFNRLAGIAGTGQTATGMASSLGQNYANQAGQNTMNANALAGNAWMQGGQARASGYTGMNNAFQGGINNMFSIFGMKQAGLL